MGDKLAAELHLAVVELSSRGLTHAAKWAAEQLVSLGAQAAVAPITADAAQDQEPRYMLAKLYFDTKVSCVCSDQSLYQCKNACTCVSATTGVSNGPPHLRRVQASLLLGLSLCSCLRRFQATRSWKPRPGAVFASVAHAVTATALLALARHRP